MIEDFSRSTERVIEIPRDELVEVPEVPRYYDAKLLNAVWGYDSFPITRTVDTHLGKLRAKIEDAANDPRFILTVHRLGYKFIG